MNAELKLAPAADKPSLIATILLTILPAAAAVLAFPDFELWFLAWVALAPFFYALWQVRFHRVRTFLAGWLFGAVFIYGTCWWLTYAPITYINFPAALAYAIMLVVAGGVGLFFAIFALLQGRLFRRYGIGAVMFAPIVWTGVEYLRYLLTGNAWNALGYSQAFVPQLIQPAKYGSFYLVGFLIVAFNAALFLAVFARSRKAFIFTALIVVFVSGLLLLSQPAFRDKPDTLVAVEEEKPAAIVVAIQPNVPMAGLDSRAWERLRQVQADTAARVLQTARRDGVPEVIVLPESPMNYQYDADPEFRVFLRNYTQSVDAAILFNSAEPALGTEGGLHNSAVMVGETGAKIGQYNKIHLMPFGEYVPFSQIVSQVMPPMLGSYEFGRDTNLLPFGDAKAGIMICFESHFGNLSRQFALNGADVLVEMTNDGYLGPTPVLKQHLASAVFRAVETGRPLLRVTNVGISGYIKPDGQILGESKSYVEDTRVWNVYKSDGSRTIYVMFGDWFAILCLTLTTIFLTLTFWRPKYVAKHV